MQWRRMVFFESTLGEIFMLLTSTILKINPRGTVALEVERKNNEVTDIGVYL